MVVFTEGDRVRGLGHVSRCSAYAEEWRRRGGRVAWVLDGDDVAVRMIGEDQEIRSLPWQDNPTEALMGLAAALALVDSYSATVDVLETVARMADATIFIDDLRRAYPAGLVVHPAPDPAPPSPVPSDWLEGPSWQPLRASFWDLEPRPPARAAIERILLVFGGGDLRRIGTAMARLALDVCPDAGIDLVLGAGQDTPPPRPGITVHQTIGAAAMARLMLQADVAISGAGQTVFELARCGTPTMMVGIADNQRANLDRWPDLCGFIDAGSWEADDLEPRVRAGLLSLSEASVRQAVSQRAQAIVDGQGVRRLFDRLDQTRTGGFA